MKLPTFLQKKQDSSDKSIWVVSSVLQLAPKDAFVIVCSSENQADQVIANVENCTQFYPTFNIKGYENITNLYPHLEGVVRVYKVAA